MTFSISLNISTDVQYWYERFSILPFFAKVGVVLFVISLFILLSEVRE